MTTHWPGIRHILEQIRYAVAAQTVAAEAVEVEIVVDLTVFQRRQYRIVALRKLWKTADCNIN